MGTWNSRGLRGSSLEDMINHSIEQYKKNGLALVQKIPTPITPIRIDKTSRHITLAYFEQKSTVDYLGVVQGIPICFDAKECASDCFSLQNIHSHQVEFMNQFENQKGISFFLIYFSSRDQLYYLTKEELDKYLIRAKNGGRKSFRYDELDEKFFLKDRKGILVPFLEGIQSDLNSREHKD